MILESISNGPKELINIESMTLQHGTDHIKLSKLGAPAWVWLCRTRLRVVASLDQATYSI